jgi:hypothetical protein
MTDRQACGTSLGMRLHIDLAEPLCPDCAPLATRNALTNERRHPVKPAEPQQLRDLRAVIHILAQAMSSKT